MKVLSVNVSPVLSIAYEGRIIRTGIFKKPVIGPVVLRQQACRPHGGIARVLRDERAKRLDGLVDVPLPRQHVGKAARSMLAAPPGRELPEPCQLAVAHQQVREVPDVPPRLGSPGGTLLRRRRQR